MKRIFLILVLMTILLIPLVSAEDVVGNETSSNATVAEEDAAVSEKIADTNESIGITMEDITQLDIDDKGKNTVTALEEALEYVLTGDESLKQAFRDEIILVSDHGAKVEAVDVSQEPLTEFNESHGQMILAVKGVNTSVEKMFASYEENKTPVKEDVIAVLDAYDTYQKAVSPLYQSITAAIPTGEKSTYDGKIKLFRLLQGSTVIAYGYVITGDDTIKQRFDDSLTTFDTALAELKKQFPDVSYDSLVADKETLETATKEVFTQFEANKAVTMDEILAFDKVVEELEEKFSEVIGDSETESLANLTEESAEPVANATSPA